MQKLFFSLLSLLSSLVGLYGAVRLGWHWEMAVPGAFTLLFLGLALVTGNRTEVELLDECDDDELEDWARARQQEEHSWEAPPVRPLAEQEEHSWEAAPVRPLAEQEERSWEAAPVRPLAEQEERSWEAAPVRPLAEVASRKLPSLAAPIPATRRGRHHTQRLEWGEVEEMLCSVDGPTSF